MVKIKTRQGEEFIIDDEDFYRVSEYEWVKYPSCRYIQASIDNVTTSVHRFIMRAPKGTTIDHINGNRLDNRKCNLRFCSQAQNMKNRKPNKNGASAYKGVVALPNGKYRAKINSDGIRYELGVYLSERDAVIAYNSAAKVVHGEFAYMNEMPNTRADLVEIKQLLAERAELIAALHNLAEWKPFRAHEEAMGQANDLLAKLNQEDK